MRQFQKIVALLMLAPGAVLAQNYIGGDQMAVPADYRQWVFLTSSLDLNYNTAATPSHHMLDNVFVDPASYKAFLNSGTWPDKTVLIKENRMAESAGTLSKSGQFQVGVMNLEIHVKDAQNRGIANETWVRIFNDRGSFQAKAIVAENVKPGVVVSQSIWWNRYSPDGVNCNTTTSTALTDFGAAATFFDNLVEVEPISV